MKCEFIDKGCGVHNIFYQGLKVQLLICGGVCEIPYIHESNPHSVFGDFLNGKKLVCGSNPHLSFNHPLPTGRLIE